ncbi:hypothetical protein [Nocardia wallacei]|uniref:hypothetical protein n=1 Tax=Nocardia wallacei TaxID=480035 RepID=UPI002455356D|nr:hypothetical protein [Nocardia wallacei]
MGALACEHQRVIGRDGVHAAPHRAAAQWSGQHGIGELGRHLPVVHVGVDQPGQGARPVRAHGHTVDRGVEAPARARRRPTQITLAGNGSEQVVAAGQGTGGRLHVGRSAHSPYAPFEFGG